MLGRRPETPQGRGECVHARAPSRTRWCGRAEYGADEVLERGGGVRGREGCPDEPRRVVDPVAPAGEDDRSGQPREDGGCRPAVVGLEAKGTIGGVDVAGGGRSSGTHGGSASEAWRNQMEAPAPGQGAAIGSNQVPC